jgi:anti-sigma B factor antagonist
MAADRAVAAGRPVLALNLELCHGRPGASARVELHECPSSLERPGVSRIARVALRGCIDGVAARRLTQALDDLALRGVEQVIVDCAELRHIDFRLVPGLVEGLDRLEARAGAVVLRGLSRYLRDLFRLAGCESRLDGWPASADLLEAGAGAPEPGRECAS